MGSSLIMDTIANRNNNPGNIKDSTGKFKVFSTPQEGYAALLNDLEIKKTGQSTTGIKPEHTLVDFANVYAPKSDKNDPAQYAANLANLMGVNPDTQIKDLDSGKWAEAIAQSEGYKNKAVDVKQVQTNQQRQNLETQGQPVSVNPEKAQPTFAGGVIRGLINPFAKLATSGVNLAQDLVGAPETQPFSGDYLGDVKKVGAGFDVTKGLTPENIKAVKESAGTGLELGSYLTGGGEVSAGIKAAKAGLEFGKPLLKQIGKEAATQAGLGGITGLGSALEQNKGLPDTAVSTGVGILGGGLMGTLLGGAKTGLSILKGFTPETANFIKTKGLDELSNVLESSRAGIKKLGNSKTMSELDNTISEGFIPQIAKDGKHINNNDLIKNVRDKFITPLQASKENLAKKITGSVDNQTLKDSVLNSVKTFHSKDFPVQSKLTKEINSFFDGLPNRQWTAEDLINLQNSKEISAFTKWERTPDLMTQTKGQTARSIYQGIRDILHRADPKLGELDDALTKYHGIEDTLNTLNGTSVSSGATSALAKLASSGIGRATGTAVGGALGGIPGAIAGGQAEASIGRMLTKTPLGDKVLQKGASVLRGQGAKKTEGLLQKALNETKQKVPTIKF